MSKLKEKKFELQYRLLIAIYSLIFVIAFIGFGNRILTGSYDHHVGIMLTIQKYQSMREQELKIEKKMEEIETAEAILKTLEHEINNPLANAMEQIDFLKSTYDLESIQKAEKALSRISLVIKAARQKIGTSNKFLKIKRTEDEFETYEFDSPSETDDDSQLSQVS